MNNPSTKDCGLNESSKKKASIPDKFNFNREYWIYWLIGRKTLKWLGGKSYCSDYIVWTQRIKSLYIKLSTNEKQKMQWALRNQLAYAKAEKTVVVSILLGVFAIFLAPYINYAATSIEYYSESNSRSLIESTEPMESMEATEASYSTETTEPTKAPDSTETTEPTEASDSAETTEPTEASDSAETTEPTEYSNNKTEDREIEILHIKAKLSIILAFIVEVIMMIVCFPSIEKARFSEETLKVIEQIESEKKARLKNNRRITVVR